MPLRSWSAGSEPTDSSRKMRAERQPLDSQQRDDLLPTFDAVVAGRLSPLQTGWAEGAGGAGSDSSLPGTRRGGDIRWKWARKGGTWGGGCLRWGSLTGWGAAGGVGSSGEAGFHQPPDPASKPAVISQ